MENKHVKKELASGARVIVLNTGATIPPEAEAMLQALHSRSVGGLLKHLEILEKKGPAGFLKTFYVGYGHKSIGDCGSATVFIEGVSMLAAKAIQDWRLYSGQESSTRYIDYSEQPFFDPIQTKHSQQIFETWRKLYLEAQEPVNAFLHQQFLRQEGEDEVVYEKAIAARRFDVTRSLLPAGAGTNLAWHSNLRQFSDALLLLRHHPLLEVQEVAIAIEQALQETFPGSFDVTLRYPNTEQYNDDWMKYEHLFSPRLAYDFKCVWDKTDKKLLKQYSNFLINRPEKTELPPTIAECGLLRYEFLLDFGSFRDLQRHRAAVQRMPLLTLKYGFHPWYRESMPESFHKTLEGVLEEQEGCIQKLGVSKEIQQYFIPFGYRVPCRLVGDLRALTYLVELRSTRFVHPTLREIALKMADDLQKRFLEYGLKLHLDTDPHRFDIRRGLHDIIVMK